jgi:hypothetical protein
MKEQFRTCDGVWQKALRAEEADRKTTRLRQQIKIPKSRTYNICDQKELFHGATGAAVVGSAGCLLVLLQFRGAVIGTV